MEAADLKRISKYGYDKLPICIAKTQKSLSDNPERSVLKDFGDRPQDGISSGSGFLVDHREIMHAGTADSGCETIDVEEDGDIRGLFDLNREVEGSR